MNQHQNSFQSDQNHGDIDKGDDEKDEKDDGDDDKCWTEAAEPETDNRVKLWLGSAGIHLSTTVTPPPPPNPHPSHNKHPPYIQNHHSNVHYHLSGNGNHYKRHNYCQHKKHKNKRSHEKFYAQFCDRNETVDEQDESPVSHRAGIPSDRVKFLIHNDDDSDGHSVELHQVFSEMVELHGLDDDQEWRETARWVKFEEDVEEGGDRWSKPHVSTLSLHSLFELRSSFLTGSVMLHVEAENFEQIIDILLDDLRLKHVAYNDEECQKLKTVLLRKRKHQYEAHRQHLNNLMLKSVRSLAEIGRQFSSVKANLNLHIHHHNQNNQQQQQQQSGPAYSPALITSGQHQQQMTSGGQQHYQPIVQHQQSVVLEESDSAVARDTMDADGQPHQQQQRYPTEQQQQQQQKQLLSQHIPLNELKKTSSSSNFLSPQQKANSLPKNMSRESCSSDTAAKANWHFFKKLPIGAEVMNVLVGNVDFLTYPISAFIRLRNSVTLGDLTEVPSPTRFLFILLGPPGHEEQFHEIGRAVCTLMSDEVFHTVAYKAHNRQDLLDGLDEFLDQVTVLPPGEWDPNIRIEPPTSLPSQERRTKLMLVPNKSASSGTNNNGMILLNVNRGTANEKGGGSDEQIFDTTAVHSHVQFTAHLDPALKRTGRLFGGLIADVKRKLPFYISDFTDAFNLQSLACFLYMYFAMLTPIIAFGGALEDATQKRMATFENLLSSALCGTIYALFSGQPLTIISSTGPVLIFEKILFELSSGIVDYLALRWWINMWSAIIFLIMVATEASVLVSYITRFTEENFTVLIAFVFIYESISKTYNILHTADVVAFDKQNFSRRPYCTCNYANRVEEEVETSSSVFFDEYAVYTITDKDYRSILYKSNKHNWRTNVSDWLLWRAPANQIPSNETNSTNQAIGINFSTNETVPYIDYPRVPLSYCEQVPHGALNDDGAQCYRMYDVFLFSLLLMIFTFLICWMLKQSRRTYFFPTKVRELVSDFAIIIALTCTIVLDMAVNFDTPKLNLPENFEPTLKGRPWIIGPFYGQSPWWTCLVAVVPAFLLCILLFMDHEIPIVIVNRKENKLKKGCGYHLDLLILAVGVAVSGFLGLPTHVAATLISISHVNALRVESECRTPGEKSKFCGIREQRLTAFLAYLCVGLSVFMRDLLKHIPMPVLYGIFLYMGVSALQGVQMIDRIKLFFIPAKYQPDYAYLRHIPITRVHLFTMFQLSCFFVMFLIKEFRATAIIFPLMLVAMVGVRKLMEQVFSQRELEYLDDKLPELTRRKREDAKRKREQEKNKKNNDESLLAVETEANLHVKLMTSGNIIRIPLTKNSPPSTPTMTSNGNGNGNNGIPKNDGSQQKMNISKEVEGSGVWKHIYSQAAFGFREISKDSKKKSTDEMKDR